MAQFGMFTHAERLGWSKGDVVATPAFPVIEEAYRITRRMDAPQAWFVLYIDPSLRSAERVEAFVARKGFGTYCPRQKSVREVAVRKNGADLRRNRKGIPVENRVFTAPLLPRYMLVALPATNAPFLLLDGPEARSNGIIGFIARDHLPLVIPDADVADLLERDQAGEWDATVKKGRKVVAKDADLTGKTVRVTDGPFASFNALVERHIGSDRIRARVHIFGREAPVDLALDQIEKLAAR